ncbi:putative Mg2+ transporter-C (MgtC) family protein [Singulisphaera sp. GP187]|uniref:MgtC/SapB family protein n=1 Tax=Singulisphaera sp. GP187 TaxID=1882752 RepID=UPI00092ADB84|nr:MgtC/SapB family protein [Singulisphaera sp. GP187]SIO60407.1 putative Mg2+ transporter-C (MgtC) family protein [Singulisphaera sp. GP187]
MRWWQAVVKDFSDLPELAQVVRIAVRLTVAALLGGVLGFERQRSGKAAGLRTHMLVALGAALFVLIAQQAGTTVSDMSRVIQGIATGIGFIGGGAILKQADHHEVKGLTTAAGLWLTAAVGIAAGIGHAASAVLGTVMALIILSSLHGVSRWLDRNVAPSDHGAAAPLDSIKTQGNVDDAIPHQPTQ